MKKLASLVSTALFITSVAVSSQASAMIISGNGASAWTSTNDNCPSYCSGSSTYDSNGGINDSSANSSVASSYANSRAYASLSGSTYLPSLRVEASSEAGTGADASAMAVQGYTYTGTESTTITLNYNLHGSVGVYDDMFYNYNLLQSGVAVFIGSELNYYAGSGYGTMVYENILPAEDSQQVFITSGTDVNEPGSIIFDINPGEDFFVLGYLNAISKNGFADAWNTLTLGFEDDSNLIAADISALPAPAPAAVWLFGSGLIGLLAMTRRKSLM